ncbi:MAG: FecCD family ABC transporter permease [Betaproteobacteria bacterium]
MRAGLLAPRRSLLLLGAAALVAVALALALGSVPLGVSAWADAIAGRPSTGASVLLDLRLPRVVAAFAVGGLLALAGALLQALLRNPLADPYVLGVSGGAAVASLLALAAGAGLLGMQAAAAAGALATLALLFALARRAFFGRTLRADDEAASVVLLTGVMLAAFAAALLALLLALAPDGTLRPMVFWLLGDLAGATDLRLALAACVALALALAAALKLARPLNLLLRGDVQALTQGVPVERVRRALVLVAALATGIAVALAGAVGFVGFVAPHLLRLAVGNDQRVLLPASVLGGGTLVVLADTLARTVAAPLHRPVGVVTALIGVPVFLWLLPRR